LLNNLKILRQKQQDIDNMAKTKAQQAAIAISIKKAGKKPKMAKGGKVSSIVDPKKKDPASNEGKKKDPAINSAAYNSQFNSAQTRDSANFYREALKKEILTKGHSNKTIKLGNDLQRQYNKGKTGYDKNGFPIKKSKIGGTIKSKKK